MGYLCEGEEIIIYGAGKCGRILYYKLKSKYKIKFFIDNNLDMTEIYGVKVYSLDKLKSEKGTAKIIISSELYEKEMKESLIGLGYKYFDDFIQYSMLNENEIDIISLYESFFDENKFKKSLDILCENKKLALIHGNCQTSHIKIYLSKNKEFSKKYKFIKFPHIYEDNCMGEYVKMKKYGLIKYIELLLTQYIYLKNKYSEELATDNMVKLLNKSCKVVRFSNLYFKGYFPTAISEYRAIIKSVGLFWWSYKDIDEFVKKDLNFEEIIEKIKSENYFDKWWLYKEIKAEIEATKKREEKLDIKMMDYIEKNYDKKLLFYSPNHPIEELIMELTRRILYYLNIKDMMVYRDDTLMLRAQDTLVYPSVIKHLGLDESYNHILYHPNFSLDNSMKLDLEEFVKVYIDMCF